jgi:hypothetical protein
MLVGALKQYRGLTRNETATGDSELTPAELPPTVFPALDRYRAGSSMIRL